MFRICNKNKKIRRKRKNVGFCYKDSQPSKYTQQLANANESELRFVCRTHQIGDQSHHFHSKWDLAIVILYRDISHHSPIENDCAKQKPNIHTLHNHNEIRKFL